MTTKTEAIIAAITTCLAGAGLPVRGDTAELNSFDDFPYILVDCGDEFPDPVVGMGFIYWNLTVMLLIGAEGAIPTVAPEASRQTAHRALYADRTLGGLVVDLSAGGVSRAINDENPALGVAQATYNVKYRAMEDTLE